MKLVPGKELPIQTVHCTSLGCTFLGFIAPSPPLLCAGPGILSQGRSFPSRQCRALGCASLGFILLPPWVLVFVFFRRAEACRDKELAASIRERHGEDSSETQGALQVRCYSDPGTPLVHPWPSQYCFLMPWMRRHSTPFLLVSLSLCLTFCLPSRFCLPSLFARSL